MSEKRGNQHTPPRGKVLGLSEGRAAAAGMRRLRTTAELTAVELARRFGFGPEWVHGREKGSIRMTQAEAEKIAAVLGTDYAGLLAAGAP